MPRVLIACEFSGIVRDAFIARGYDAMSCDLIDTESPGPHYIGNVSDIINDGWDLMIAHPPCTYLTNSGVRWLWDEGKINAERWAKMEHDGEFFLSLLNAPIRHVAVENPVMHRYGREIVGRATQFIQPWQFGHGEIKRTGFWLRNLPPLIPTNIVDGRNPRVHRESPSPNRWKERSRTLTGIADAMAVQWGDNILGDI